REEELDVTGPGARVGDPEEAPGDRPGDLAIDRHREIRGPFDRVRRGLADGVAEIVAELLRARVDGGELEEALAVHGDDVARDLERRRRVRGLPPRAERVAGGRIEPR